MEKRPLLICADPGIDDFVALAMLMNDPAFEICGIVSLSGNVGLDITVNNDLLVKELCRCEQIPVVAGSAKPLVRPIVSASNIHGASGLGKSVECYAETPVWKEDAADFIARMVRKYGGRLELVSLGPLTDVALTLQKHPDILPLIRDILIMGGGIRLGNATPYAEFNILADPEAAAAVFSSGVHITMVGLDATHACIMPRSAIPPVKSPCGTLGRILPAMLGDYADMYMQVHGIDGLIIHDAISILMLCHREWFTLKECCVRVSLQEENLAQTYIVPDGEANCTAAMDADREAITACISQSLLDILQKFG